MISWVCGGGRGIGAAIAKLCQDKGHEVFISTRGKETTEEEILQREQKKIAPKLNILFGDLEDANVVKKHLIEITSSSKTINAIYVCTHRPFLPDTIDNLEWEQVEDQFIGCVKPVFNIIKELCISKQDLSNLSIITMSSCTVATGESHMISRNLGKAALEAMTKSLNTFLNQKGARINTLSIGWTDTPQLKTHLNGSFLPLNCIPIGRVANPDEIASTALFLASLESSYITGTVFPVSGGLYTEL